MNIRKMVLNTLREQPDVEMTSKEVLELIHEWHLGAAAEVTREQVSNSLADLAVFGEIERVRRGVYTYRKPSEPESVSVEPTDEMIESALEELGVEGDSDDPEDGRYFTQVGVAENGDLIITRDSDTKVYRATPI